MELLPVKRIELLQDGSIAVTPSHNPSKMLRFIYRAALGVEWEEDASRLVCEGTDEKEMFARIGRALKEEMGLAMQLTQQTEWSNISEALKRSFEDIIVAQQAAQEGHAAKPRAS